MTTPYKPCGNSICERFNPTLLGLLQSLPKEQKSCWAFTHFIIMPHLTALLITSPMSSCLGIKHPPFVMFGWGWPIIMIRPQSASVCVVEWTAWAADEINRWTLMHIRQSVKKSQVRACGKTLHILIGNLVLLQDHPEGWKNSDNYKSKLFVVVDHHKDPNV